MLQLVVRFLVGNNHYPIGSEGPNNRLVAAYHIVPEVMKAAKNTAEILLDKTVSILPILNARYNLCGGRTVKWKTPAKYQKTSCNMMKRYRLD
jgi:hypothetical protein